MSTLFCILKEEYERLLDVTEQYRNLIQKEQRGTPRIKTIGKKKYVYLVYRSEKKLSINTLALLIKKRPNKL